MFLPGELTQSLCSPWTHDFRDCACYYWASNHPDIALPPLPVDNVANPRWNLAVPWERSERNAGQAAVAGHRQRSDASKCVISKSTTAGKA